MLSASHGLQSLYHILDDSYRQEIERISNMLHELERRDGDSETR